MLQKQTLPIYWTEDVNNEEEEFRRNRYLWRTTGKSHTMWLHTRERSNLTLQKPRLPVQKSAETSRVSSAASSRGQTKTGLLDEEGPPGCICSAGMLAFHRQVKAPVRWGDQQSLSLRPATQAARWFSCSLQRQPGSSSPALRAAFACPSDPCGTPAPPAGGTSSSSPAPADFSAQNWFNGLVISKALN